MPLLSLPIAVASGQGLCILPDALPCSALCFAGSALFMDFWTAASHVLCPCCWALSSAVILKGTFSSFHPFRCNCSSQVIFVVQLGLHMGFLPVFVLFVTFFCCPLTTAMTSTLPMAEFFHCSVPCESKPGEVTVSKGLCSVGACSHQ